MSRREENSLLVYVVALFVILPLRLAFNTLVVYAAWGVLAWTGAIASAPVLWHAFGGGFVLWLARSVVAWGEEGG